MRVHLVDNRHMDQTSRSIRRMLTALLAIALASIAAVGCSSASKSTSTATPSAAFIAEDGRFTAEFPTSPVRGQEAVTAAGFDLVIVMYSTETDKESVMVGYTDYPEGLGSEGVLDGAAEGSAANINGTIQSKTDTTFVGHPAIDVVVTTAEATVHERIFLVDNRLYTVLGVSRSGRPASYDRLLETFALL